MSGESRTGSGDKDEWLALSSESHEQSQTTLHSLTHQERDKLEWLLGLIRGLDGAQHDFNVARREVVIHEGVVVDREFDWRQVAARMLPELGIVLAVSRDREIVYPFPLYAVVPRLSTHVNLQTVTPTSEAPPDTSLESVVAALKVLDAYVAGIAGSRGRNAKAQLTILKRIAGVGT